MTQDAAAAQLRILFCFSLTLEEKKQNKTVSVEEMSYILEGWWKTFRWLIIKSNSNPLDGKHSNLLPRAKHRSANTGFPEWSFWKHGCLVNVIVNNWKKGEAFVFSTGHTTHFFAVSSTFVFFKASLNQMKCQVLSTLLPWPDIATRVSLVWKWWGLYDAPVRGAALVITHYANDHDNALS